MTTLPVGEEFTWDTTSFADAKGVLKFEYLDARGRMAYQFELGGTIINDPDIVIHRGIVSEAEIWAADKVHVVVCVTQ